jgi:3-oxoacid CoA-transferase
VLPAHFSLVKYILFFLVSSFMHDHGGTIYAKGGVPIKYKENSTTGEVEIESEPKETRMFLTDVKGSDGTYHQQEQEYVLEPALRADLALVKAYKADTRGNLIFRGTARNLNPDCAMSGRVTIAEAEMIVPAGALDPDEVHCPGIYVDYVVQATHNEKRIERLREQPRDEVTPDEEMPHEIELEGNTMMMADEKNKSLEPNIADKDRARGLIMRRAGKEFQDGMYVNLGIGIPTMASNYVPEGVDIELHSENGLLGTGPYPLFGEADPDFTNAGKESVTALPGSSTFCTSESFNIIRGGHLCLTMLGALECSANGDLASCEY